jgi:O-antigen/teichoic acid export membrane protein
MLITEANWFARQIDRLDLPANPLVLNLGSHEESWPRLADDALFAYGFVGAVVCAGTAWLGEPVIRLLYTDRLPETYPMFAWLAVCLPFALTAYVPGAWLPARHGEALKMAVVLGACVLVWTILFLAGRYLSPLAIGTWVSVAWILQSLSLWAIARIRYGLRPPWFGVLLAPTASATVVAGSLAGLPLLSGAAFVVAAAALGAGRWPLRRAKS